MNLRKKRKPKTRAPQDLRAKAYHEAGHAAMYFFFGEADDLHSVDIILNPRKDRAGRTRARAFDRAFAMMPASGGTENYHRIAAIKCIMIDLAGPSAESKVVFPDCPGLNWLEVERMSQTWEPDPLSDFGKAIGVTRAFCGEERSHRRFMTLLGRWTDEAIRSPRMWGVIEVLAAELLGRRRLGGRAASRIMEEAWGSGDPFPFLSTRIWRRRFRTNQLRVKP